MGFSRLEYWSGVPLPSPSDRVGKPQVSPQSPPLYLAKRGQQARGRGWEAKNPYKWPFLLLFPSSSSSGNSCANSGSEAHRTPRAPCPSTHLCSRVDNKLWLREIGFPRSTMQSQSPSSLPQGPSCSILPAPGFTADTPASFLGTKAGLAKDVPGFLGWFLGFSQAKPATFGLFLPTGRVVGGGSQSGAPLLPQRASAPHLAPTQPLVVMVEKAHPGLPLLLPGSLLLHRSLRGGHHGGGDLHRPPL